MFVANDIGKILDYKSIKSTLRDYKEGEILRGVRISHPGSDSGFSDINMLTEKGLYKLIYISKSKLADMLRDFVYNLLHDLRTKKISIIENENNQLKQEKEEQNKIIEDQNKLIEEQKNLIIDPKQLFNEKMKNKELVKNIDCILYAFSSKENEEKNLYKIGITEDTINKRLSCLNTSISIEAQKIYSKFYIRLNKKTYKHFEKIFHGYLEQFHSHGEWHYIHLNTLKTLFK